MTAVVFLPILAAITCALVAAYLLSGLDDWQPRERRRDSDSLQWLPRARRAYERRSR